MTDQTNEELDIDTNPYSNRQARINDTQTVKKLTRHHDKMVPFGDGPDDSDLEELIADESDNDSNESEDTSESEESEEMNAQDTENTEEDINKNRKVKLKVLGSEEEVSYEELVARAQKVSAADEYLRMAKNTYDLSLQDDQKSPIVDSTKRNDLADEDIVQAIQMGDEEEARVALHKFRDSILKEVPSVNTDELMREIEEKTRYTSALESFKTEYKDLIEDEYLLAAVFAEERKQLANNDTRDFKVRFTEIGDKVRSWAGSTRSSSTTEKLTNDEKQERKRNAKSAPKSNAIRSTTQDDSSDDSYEAKVEKMRMSRPAHLARQGLL